MNPPEKQSRHALFLIFVTVLLDMLSLGIIVPVLPKLVSTFLDGDTARAAKAIGLFATVWALMQFIASPLLGMLSDRFGRRPVILLSNFGLALDYLVMAVAPTLGWLFAGRIMSGITAATIGTANAYIADVTPAQKRARAYGMIGAAFGAGFILGPAFGGWLGGYDARLPFWVAAVLSFINGLYALFVLPESLPPAKRTLRLDWRQANPLGALRMLGSHRELFGLSLVNFLGFVAHEIYPTVFVLYAIYRYAWSEGQIGLSLALVGVSSMIISAGVVGPVVARLGERRALLVGLALGSIGFFLFGSAATGWMFLLGIPINCLWALSGPPTQSMMTQRVSANEQGELQGAIGVIRSIAMLAGPTIFSFAFAASISPERSETHPGAAWYVAALLVFMSLIVAWFVARGQPARTVETEESSA